MPSAKALDALKAAYRGQIAWLLAWAFELDAGETRIIRKAKGADIDITAEIAADYRLKAVQLESIVTAYERLADPKET
jgi:hypothetical protein